MKCSIRFQQQLNDRGAFWKAILIEPIQGMQFDQVFSVIKLHSFLFFVNFSAKSQQRIQKEILHASIVFTYVACEITILRGCLDPSRLKFT